MSIVSVAFRSDESIARVWARITGRQVELMTFDIFSAITVICSALCIKKISINSVINRVFDDDAVGSRIS